MNESWIDSIRFSLAAILAASLFGIATLSPLVVRNEKFKQLCYDKQLELIDLEADNTRRELFAKRLENSPELMEQISRENNNEGITEPFEQSIILPEALAIHPDQMLIAPSASEKPAIRQATTFSKSRLYGIAEDVAASATIQNRLLIAAILLLLAGIIPAAWFHWKFFSQQFAAATTNVLSRYNSHSSHEKIPSPHWDSSNKPLLRGEKESNRGK